MTVEIYTDESVPVAVAAGLNRRGVTAISARDAGNLGLSDEEQLIYAITNGLVLFTHDTDFFQLAYRHSQSPQPHCGVIYAHQDKLSIGECIRRLKEIADLYEPSDFRNHIEFL
jgi:predicted nuclease of predicted toxin-antitoxin system